MAYEETPCFACEFGVILVCERPMERPTRTVCGHCGGTGMVSVYVYPKRRRRAS